MIKNLKELEELVEEARDEENFEELESEPVIISALTMFYNRPVWVNFENLAEGQSATLDRFMFVKKDGVWVLQTHGAWEHLAHGGDVKLTNQEFSWIAFKASVIPLVGWPVSEPIWKSESKWPIPN